LKLIHDDLAGKLLAGPLKQVYVDGFDLPDVPTERLVSYQASPAELATLPVPSLAVRKVVVDVDV